MLERVETAYVAPGVQTEFLSLSDERLPACARRERGWRGDGGCWKPEFSSPYPHPLRTASLFDFTSFPVSIQATGPSFPVKSPSVDRSTVSTLGSHPRLTVRPFMPRFAGFIDRPPAFADISMSSTRARPSLCAILRPQTPTPVRNERS